MSPKTRLKNLSRFVFIIVFGFAIYNEIRSSNLANFLL
ncbi:hypothetical protein UNSWCS_1854 [Campylobacter concisus UNSWCS]|uniref:Uncharacterized protein n=1 Tax=Campylobacter concisus UNSWCS TaxID=1242968 RepID=U2FJL7_9BACT|nr:hypothetical protein UNSWCS_1854 [Campylobacter concisus UNSWCS]